MPDSAPLIRTLTVQAPAQATAGTAQTTEIDAAPFAATVTGVTFIPNAAITGQATNYRTFSVINKAQDGTGATTVATLAFSGSGVTIAASDEGTLTLSGTAANLVVAAGDVLAFVETVTGTGLASPGGLVRVQLTRS